MKSSYTHVKFAHKIPLCKVQNVFGNPIRVSSFLPAHSFCITRFIQAGQKHCLQTDKWEPSLRFCSKVLGVRFECETPSPNAIIGKIAGIFDREDFNFLLCLCQILFQAKKNQYLWIKCSFRGLFLKAFFEQFFTFLSFMFFCVHLLCGSFRKRKMENFFFTVLNAIFAPQCVVS